MLTSWLCLTLQVITVCVNWHGVKEVVRHIKYKCQYKLTKHTCTGSKAFFMHFFNSCTDEKFILLSRNTLNHRDKILHKAF